MIDVLPSSTIWCTPLSPLVLPKQMVMCSGSSRKPQPCCVLHAYTFRLLCFCCKPAKSRAIRCERAPGSSTVRSWINVVDRRSCVPPKVLPHPSIGAERAVNFLHNKQALGDIMGDRPVEDWSVLVLSRYVSNIIGTGDLDATRVEALYRREQAEGILADLLAEHDIGEPEGQMEFRSSHVANYWMARVLDGAFNVSGSSVDVGKTWGFPRNLIDRALERAGMNWPGTHVFDPDNLNCRTLAEDVPGPESDPASGPDSRTTGVATREATREGLVAAALEVALLQINDEETSWFISTGQLDLVSTSICRVARGASVASVVVNEMDTVNGLLRSKFNGVEYQGRFYGGSRELEPRVRELPPASALRVVWRTHDCFWSEFNLLRQNMQRVKWLSIEADLLAPFDEDNLSLKFPPRLVELHLHGSFDQSIEGVEFPKTVKKISLGGSLNAKFDRSICGVQWPKYLEELKVEGAFNHPIEQLQLPDSVKYVFLGGQFNKPIAAVTWPKSLEQLTFGEHFNKELTSTANGWPEGLISLETGTQFFQSLDDAVLPPGLKRLHLGDGWNQSMGGVTLPQGLEVVVLGERFNRRLNNVQWNSNAIRVISFKLDFNKAVDGVEWPGSLEVVRFGDGFSKWESLSRTLWPSTLLELEIGGGMDPHFERVTLPQSLQKLVLGGAFNGVILGARLPPGLQSLVFGKKYLQPISGRQCWPQTLKEMSFGPSYREELLRVSWPSAIVDLRFEGMADDDKFVKNCVWPKSVERVQLRGGVVLTRSP